MAKPKSKPYRPRRRPQQRPRTATSKAPGLTLSAPHGIDSAQWRSLRPRQQKFILAYLTTLNGSQAAREAGYSPHTARDIAAENLAKPHIAAIVEQGLQANLKGMALTREGVLEIIRRHVYMDPRCYWDTAGNLKAITDLTEEEAAALAGFEVIIKNAEAGDGHLDTVHKIKLADRSRYVEMAAKHFRLLEDAKGGGAQMTIEKLVVLIQQRPADWESRK